MAHFWRLLKRNKWQTGRSTLTSEFWWCSHLSFTVLPNLDTLSEQSLKLIFMFPTRFQFNVLCSSSQSKWHQSDPRNGSLSRFFTWASQVMEIMRYVCIIIYRNTNKHTIFLYMWQRELKHPADFIGNAEHDNSYQLTRNGTGCVMLSTNRSINK